MNRRESLHLIAGGALALAAGLLARISWERQVGSGPRAVLAPEMVEGGSYIDPSKIRRDITDGRAGVPLRLRLTLVDLPENAPLPDSAVDIWHCDAAGDYSGFPATAARPPGYTVDMAPTGSERWLRGTQITDANGVVEFLTIYPGWYATRDTHIHLKVHIEGTNAPTGYTGGHVCHVGQLFFPDEVNDAVALLKPYADCKTERTPKGKDKVFATEHGELAVMKVSPQVINGVDGYLAEMTLGIDPATQPPPVKPPGPVVKRV